MRFHIKISPNKRVVPFEHQVKIVGAIHKWLGENVEHGTPSLYSFSRLQNGKKKGNGLSFGNGTSFFISSYDNSFLKRLYQGIKESPEIAYGMEVREIIVQQEPDFENTNQFLVASPVLVKQRDDNGIKHLLFSDEKSSELLTATLKHKMQIAKLPEFDFNISFVKDYSKAKSMLISYKGIKNKANWCPVIINGSNEVKQFAWNVGIGHSTGIGFGSLI